MSAVSIEEFKRAVQALEIALNAEKTDLHRDAAIQRFEFCVELGWKTSKKIMGTLTTTPKQVVREMAQALLIDDPEIWLQSIDKRNLSSHTYREALAQEVYAFAQNFLPHLKQLLLKLEQE